MPTPDDAEKAAREEAAFMEVVHKTLPLSPDAKTMKTINERLAVMEAYVKQREYTKQIVARKTPQHEETPEPLPDKSVDPSVVEELGPDVSLIALPAGIFQESERPTPKQIIRPSYSVPKVSIPSLRQPALKSHSKMSTISNTSRMQHALEHYIFPSSLNSQKFATATETINNCSARHFLVLFREHMKCQYRGLYSWDQSSEKIHKILGQGPDSCEASAVKMMFKYNTGTRAFAQLSVKSFGNSTDGFTIADTFWMRKMSTPSVVEISN